MTEPAADRVAPVARRRGLTALVMIAATLGVLLVGAAGGVLLEQSLSGRGAVVEPGVVDFGFAQDMTGHHRQAVTMASWTRDHSNVPAIRQLAFDVESTQLEQVGRMQSWLAVWNRPPASQGGYMAWMVDPAGHGHSQASGSLIPLGGVTVMPGMATQQELAKLRSLSGHDLDVFFLQLVLRHHAGGAPMARYVAEHANLGAVRALAKSVVASQTAEMAAITSMLTELGGHPLK
jgi:uncharacterized protein (DUF305 family)